MSVNLLVSPVPALIERDGFKYRTLHLLQAWLDSDVQRLLAIDQWASQTVAVGVHCNGRVDTHADNPIASRPEDNYDWLTYHGLMPIFASLLSKHRINIPHSGEQHVIQESWRLRHLACLSRSLRLEGIADRVKNALDAWGGHWSTIKGFSLARRVYEHPSLRITGDIDILVAPQDLNNVIEVLLAIGGGLDSRPSSSHEQSVCIKGIFLDVHEAPIRTGRLRFNPTAEWLSRTQRVGGFPCLADHDELLLSFFHPAITDYLTGRTIRFVDILLQIRRNREPTDWQRLAGDARRLGVANAAYATAIRVNHLFSSNHEPPLPERFLDALKVDPFRRRYWRFWRDRQPDSLFAANPLLAQALFNLWLNDSPSDWLRALRDKRRAVSNTYDLSPSRESSIFH